jgi:DNA-binding transcriptional ArsR family regulator
MRRVLWWLIGGARGGRNRLRIVRTLQETPMNANQLSNELDLDYKTTQHHLELLTDNDVLMTMGEEYGKVYFLTDRMEDNVDLLEEIADKADLEPTADGGSGGPER